MTKRQLREENTSLQHRVHELEEIMCPCQQHKLIEIERHFIITMGAPTVEGYNARTMQCTICKKIIEM